MSNLTIDVLVVQILLQSIAAFYVVLSYIHTKHDYLAYLGLAFILMTLRRITALLDITNMWVGVEFLDKVVLPLAITILVLKGSYNLYNFYKITFKP